MAVAFIVRTTPGRTTTENASACLFTTLIGAGARLALAFRASPVSLCFRLCKASAEPFDTYGDRGLLDGRLDGKKET